MQKECRVVEMEHYVRDGTDRIGVTLELDFSKEDYVDFLQMVNMREINADFQKKVHKPKKMFAEVLQ